MQIASLIEPVESPPRAPRSLHMQRRAAVSPARRRLLQETKAQQGPSRELHRLKVRADGRCAVRAVLAGASLSKKIGMDDSSEARTTIRNMRIAATNALQARMANDADFEAVVRWSFPDESFETFEAWLDAQRSDDTDSAISTLWHGGGQWLLYGLGLHLHLKIVIHSVDRSSLALVGPTKGTVLIDGGDGATVVRLASLRDGDGAPDHFDLLVEGPQPGAEPLREFGGATSTHARPPRLGLLAGWVALNVFVLALALGHGPQMLKLAGDLMTAPEFGSRMIGDDLLSSQVMRPMIETEVYNVPMVVAH